MGGPKALLRDGDGVAWVVRSASVLAVGGCDPVLTVVGAAAGQVREVLPAGVLAVTAAGWAEGMGASLRDGLAALGALPEPGPEAVVVGLVDTPGVSPAVVARLVAVAGPAVLARAAYGGRPGHPVLLGREHWAGVAALARGDRGAREYLSGRRDVRLVECGDAGHGEDRDTPAS